MSHSKSPRKRWTRNRPSSKWAMPLSSNPPSAEWSLPTKPQPPQQQRQQQSNNRLRKQRLLPESELSVDLKFLNPLPPQTSRPTIQPRPKWRPSTRPEFHQRNPSRFRRRRRPSGADRRWPSSAAPRRWSSAKARRPARR